MPRTASTTMCEREGRHPTRVTSIARLRSAQGQIDGAGQGGASARSGAYAEDPYSLHRHALIGSTPGTVVSLITEGETPVPTGAAPEAEPVALASADYRADVLGNRYRTRSDCKGRSPRSKPGHPAG